MPRADWRVIRQTKQPLDWIDLQKKVPEVVRVGYYRGRYFGAEPLACAGGALSRSVGRRADGRKANIWRSSR